MANFKYSAAGMDLTKQFEGCKLTAYQDSVGVWTIGYGHTGAGVLAGLTITDEQATVLLAADVAREVTRVNKSVKSAIRQNQFDAMVDSVFNLGCMAFNGLTLLKMVNAGDFAGATGEFARWNKAEGKVLAGLTKQRAAEAAPFRGPVGAAPGGVPAVSANAVGARIPQAAAVVETAVAKAAKKLR